MNKTSTTILTGIVIDETTTLTLQELCYTCQISTEEVDEMIAHGLVEPQIKKSQELIFDGEALRRMKLALRLQHDLGVNLPGAALALELLNELQALRKQMELIEKIK